ncbi:nitrous oxide reductase accessory protein NosL [Aquabacterium humicola]|uniref:nitrous oxide reductase accessory protein NosL n=1 Tax=Aquabacterium humicola TaxID=3237377 RepID=UPI002542D6FE|nr:nitrous oxide reductase accessory protein NosL [Rubrivivax pictus]
MNPARRRLFCAACAVPFAALVAGCGDSKTEAASAAAQDFTSATTCELDGMSLADYPGPKAQVHYANAAAPVFFCDTVELFAALLNPEQVRAVRAAYVQDMARADWNQPRGHWIDAKSAWFVVGSKRHGSMGPTFASFAAEDAARQFAGQHGGKALRYAEVKPDMADLSGGAKHDARM